MHSVVTQRTQRARDKGDERERRRASRNSTFESVPTLAICVLLQTNELGVGNRGRALIVCRDNQRLQGLGQGKIWHCKGGCSPQSRAYGAIAEVTPILRVYYSTKSGL